MISKQLLGVPIKIGSYSSFIDNILHLAKRKHSSYVCVLNVHMLMECFRDNVFKKFVEGAEIVTPDGKPICWSLRLLHGINQERVAGMDLLPHLLSNSEVEQLPVFFYGGSLTQIRNTKRYMESHFPNLQAGYYSPPFRPLEQEEEKSIVEIINSANARIVFVALGCPKQERWMAAMKGKINGVMIGIGGALPVMIGQHKRAPVWMQKCGLEWLFRLLLEPRRLFKRYFTTNTLFIYLLFKAYFKKALNF